MQGRRGDSRLSIRVPSLREVASEMSSARFSSSRLPSTRTGRSTVTGLSTLTGRSVTTRESKEGSASPPRTKRESAAGRIRRQSVIEVRMEGIPEGVREEDFNESDWSWTTATPSPTPVIPSQEEIWEAVEDGDNFDVDAICQEGEIDVNYVNPLEVSVGASRGCDPVVDVNPRHWCTHTPARAHHGQSCSGVWLSGSC